MRYESEKESQLRLISLFNMVYFGSEIEKKSQLSTDI
jgi:hypothetical protein